MCEIQRVEFQNTNGMELKCIDLELETKGLEVREMGQGSKRANSKVEQWKTLELSLEIKF